MRAKQSRSVVRIDLRLDLDLNEQLDAKRGDVPKVVYIRRLIEQDLRKGKRS